MGSLWKLREVGAMSVEGRLNYILKHPDDVNTFTTNKRPISITMALYEALPYIPHDTPEHRGIAYLVKNEAAIFNFGGKDIIRPAIEMALENMKTGRPACKTSP